MIILGLMSGTSLDGLDMALCDINGTYLKTECSVIETKFAKIPNNLKSKILKACDEKESNNRLICSLNFEIGKWYSLEIKKFLEEIKYDKNNISYISSHGQTIYHLPNPNNDEESSTLQIGEPAVIAYELNIPVISNFRVMDMAAGGVGAPLVPYVDYILFKDNNKNIALQNLGGIGNVTFISKNGDIDDIIAFDTGPANVMIDEAMRIYFNKEYDENGYIASKGSIIIDLFEKLCSNEYFKVKPPKSTGREYFGREYTHEILKRYINEKKEDIVATLTKFTSYSIYKSYKDYILNENKIDEIILSGGGAYNKEIIRYLKEYLPNIEITTQMDKGYENDFKEAIAFAILGNETVNGHFSNVKSVTGAKDRVILGNITLNPIKK